MLFQDGKDLLLGANSKSPTVMGKDPRLVDAGRLWDERLETNFISDRTDEYQGAALAGNPTTTVSSGLWQQRSILHPVLILQLCGSKHRLERAQIKLRVLRLHCINTAGDGRIIVVYAPRGAGARKTENAGDHHRCREETTSMLELLEHELLGLLPRVFGVS